MRVLVINGPNLNLLGYRQPEIYGNESLDEIIKFTESALKNEAVEIEWYQSNIEGEIVDRIQKSCKDGTTCLIINPGGYSHSSVSIYDALKLLNIIIIEVHLTNTHSREEFRKKRITAMAANIVIEGLKREVYLTAIKSQLAR